MAIDSRTRKHFDLILVAVAAVLAGALVLSELAFTAPGLIAPILGGVRVGFGLALALLLPGYALTAAIFPQGSLGRWGMIAYSLGLSLVLGTLGGFVLNTFPSGLRSGPWAVFLVAVTLLASGLALARRRTMAPNDLPIVRSSLKVSLRQGILFVLAGLLALSAIQLAILGAARQPRPGFTQFWMLPAEEAETETMRVGLRSFELTETQYILEIKLDNERIQAYPGKLAPGQQFTMTVYLPPVPAESDEPAKVEAFLYRLEELDQPYRHLIWWR